MKEKKFKILIIANCFWYIYNFRLDLIKDLKKSGYEVFIVAPSDQYKDLVKDHVDEVINWNLIRGSINPFLEIRSILELFFLYKKYKPNLIHAFTIKPSLYGGFVSKIMRQKKLILHVTGIGPAFFGSNRSIRILSFLLKPIYRFSFSHNSRVIFHNKYDKKFFLQKNLCDINSTFVIQGSGVNTEFFKNNKLKKRYFSPIQILFPARIIRQKGFIELFETCLELWEEGYVFKLNVAGEIDNHNKSTLTDKEINTISSNKNINFFGKIKDMKSVYSKTDIVILPSWREGLSKSLIEAAAMSLPVITYDVPGCKEIIENEKSGLLVPLKNKYFLKKAMIKLIKNPQLGIRYGLKGREIVKNKFELKHINNKILSTYKKLLSDI